MYSSTVWYKNETAVIEFFAGATEDSSRPAAHEIQCHCHVVILMFIIQPPYHTGSISEYKYLNFTAIYPNFQLPLLNPPILPSLLSRSLHPSIHNQHSVVTQKPFGDQTKPRPRRPRSMLSESMATKPPIVILQSKNVPPLRTCLTEAGPHALITYMA